MWIYFVKIPRPLITRKPWKKERRSKKMGVCTKARSQPVVSLASRTQCWQGAEIKSFLFTTDTSLCIKERVGSCTFCCSPSFSVVLTFPHKPAEITGSVQVGWFDAAPWLAFNLNESLFLHSYTGEEKKTRSMENVLKNAEKLQIKRNNPDMYNLPGHPCNTVLSSQRHRAFCSCLMRPRL